MITYQEYTLSEKQIDLLKKVHANVEIGAYIKKHGVAPENPGIFYTYTNEEFENFKRTSTASIYCSQRTRASIPSLL